MHRITKTQARMDAKPPATQATQATQAEQIQSLQHQVNVLQNNQRQHGSFYYNSNPNDPLTENDCWYGVGIAVMCVIVVAIIGTIAAAASYGYRNHTHTD